MSNKKWETLIGLIVAPLLVGIVLLFIEYRTGFFQSLTAREVAQTFVPTHTPYPTYTPYPTVLRPTAAAPTHTPYPTFTPYPTLMPEPTQESRTFVEVIRDIPKNEIFFWAGLFFLFLGVVSRIKIQGSEITTAGKSGVAIFVGAVLLIVSLLPAWSSPQFITGPSDTGSHTEQEISAEQAIKNYHSLIERQQYKSAYAMLSESHKINASVPTLDRYISEWKKSGPASIIQPIKTNEDGNNATSEFTVYYYCGEGRAYHRFRYTLKRNVGCGNPQFGCWLVQRVDEVPIPFTRVLYLTSPRMNGEDVQTVQYKLLCLGYQVGEVDGYFGPNTESAVRRFQEANGLNIDGVVGQKTWEKLFPVLKP